MNLILRHLHSLLRNDMIFQRNSFNHPRIDDNRMWTGLFPSADMHALIQCCYSGSDSQLITFRLACSIDYDDLNDYYCWRITMMMITTDWQTEAKRIIHQEEGESRSRTQKNLGHKLFLPVMMMMMMMIGSKKKKRSVPNLLLFAIELGVVVVQSLRLGNVVAVIS